MRLYRVKSEWRGSMNYTAWYRSEKFIDGLKYHMELYTGLLADAGFHIEQKEVSLLGWMRGKPR